VSRGKAGSCAVCATCGVHVGFSQSSWQAANGRSLQLPGSARLLELHCCIIGSLHCLMTRRKQWMQLAASGFRPTNSQLQHRTEKPLPQPHSVSRHCRHHGVGPSQHDRPNLKPCVSKNHQQLCAEAAACSPPSLPRPRSRRDAGHGVAARPRPLPAAHDNSSSTHPCMMDSGPTSAAPAIR
jgi:hypothetical protein